MGMLSFKAMLHTVLSTIGLVVVGSCPDFTSLFLPGLITFSLHVCFNWSKSHLVPAYLISYMTYCCRGRTSNQAFVPDDRRKESGSPIEDIQIFNAGEDNVGSDTFVNRGFIAPEIWVNNHVNNLSALVKATEDSPDLYSQSSLTHAQFV